MLETSVENIVQACMKLWYVYGTKSLENYGIFMVKSVVYGTNYCFDE